MNATRFLVFGICWLWVGGATFRSSGHATERPLFAGEAPLELRVVLPIKSLKNQREENPNWLRGTVYVKESGELGEAFDVQIKARGHFRRKRSSCSFPSYWLNFKKKQVVGSVFEGQDKIKVVAHCREGFQSFDDYIYKEYLAYRTYQILTDASFRVRLARIEYEDTKSTHVDKPRVAFFIEHVKGFEDRQDARQYKKRYIEPSKYDARALCRAELFQYLLGNTDFTFFASEEECCHNAKAFRYPSMNGAFAPVPYDFDMAGVVDPPYAVANSKLSIDSVTERLYRGLTVSDEILEETLQLYREKEDEVMSLWESFEPLGDGHRSEALAFLSEFFATIDDPESVKEKIVAKMRSREALERLVKRKEDALMEGDG